MNTILQADGLENFCYVRTSSFQKPVHMATSDFQKLFYDDTSGLQDNDIISTGAMSIFIEAV
jgi:hypothetical protein